MEAFSFKSHNYEVTRMKFSLNKLNWLKIGISQGWTKKIAINEDDKNMMNEIVNSEPLKLPRASISQIEESIYTIEITIESLIGISHSLFDMIVQDETEAKFKLSSDFKKLRIMQKDFLATESRIGNTTFDKFTKAKELCNFAIEYMGEINIILKNNGLGKTNIMTKFRGNLLQARKVFERVD